MVRLFGNTKEAKTTWGTSDQNGVGKFNNISEKALKEIKAMGISHVWYTGIISHSTWTKYEEFGIPGDHPRLVKGRAGSPYAIKDYFDVDPDLAVSVDNRMDEFQSLVNRSHKCQLGVIIDFVPNHVARQYKSLNKPDNITDLGDDDASKAFDPQNNFYYLPGHSFSIPSDYQPPIAEKAEDYIEMPAKASGNDVFSPAPSKDDWFETIKLNYGIDYRDNSLHFDPIPDTWHKMREILLFWASKGIDGFRCDMAEMVPTAFWEWVIPEIKQKYQKVLFIAEVYDPTKYHSYLSSGFDFLYDKVQLYDTLKKIIQGHSSADELTQVWQQQEGITNQMLRFLENHDEQRIASPYFAGDMRKGIPMMAAAAFMHKGPLMIYFGQEVGEPAEGVSGFSGEDGRTTIFDYWSVPQHQKWMNNGLFDGGKLSKEQIYVRNEYINILTSCNQIKALRSGDFFDLQYFNRNDQFCGYSDKVYAFIRHFSTHGILVLINFNSEIEKTALKIPLEALQRIGSDMNKVLSINNEAINTIDLVDYSVPSALSHDIPPLSYLLFKLENK